MWARGLQSILCFLPCFYGFQGGASLKSGSTLPKDKAGSRRQYGQYGKAKPTQYFGKESRYFRDAGRLGGSKGLIV